MVITATTFISDTITFIRDDLDDNITDPISSSREKRDRFVMTSYPQRTVKYPIITVTLSNSSLVQRLGMRSEGFWTEMEVEIRVWATNMKQRDELSSLVANRIRLNQFGTGSSTDFGLHDVDITSTVPVTEPGDAGIKSLVYTVTFKAILET